MARIIAAKDLCPKCHTDEGRFCRDYRGKKKPTCRERLEAPAAVAAGERYVEKARATPSMMVQRTIEEAAAACAAEAARAEVVELDPANPCARCGKPTIRGLNTDFCSLACEGAHRAENPEPEELRLEAPAAPRARLSDAAWGGEQLDLFQRSLCEAPSVSLS